ncbi:hypothetical protein N0V87_003269 [Didymella glomerata]|uniref:Uncharacterized protein n=1 Tax=Didymella glomerata TaxID=749621 RepID=A0A9W9C0X3_9PLEO|nr:hypothetical protein N0V87_003269 [Didymella glomerata]
MANSPNQTLEKSFINALDQTNGTKVLDQILEKNPEFTKTTTRLEIWDAVAKEFSNQGVFIHLDNHMSKAFYKVTATKTAVFRPDDFVFKDKVVLEIHKYDFGAIKDDCGTFKSKWYKKGFQSVKPEDTATKYLFPMVISEWGFFNNYHVSWMHWERSGFIYLQTCPGRKLQETIQDSESWDLLNYDWSAVRSPITLEKSLYKMIGALR